MKKILSEKEKQKVIELFNTGKYTLKEIAEQLSLSESGVSYVISGCFKKSKQNFK